MGRLTGKVAMITGASKGLGRAIALAFAREGARLVICARGHAGLRAVTAEIEALGAEVLPVQADASRKADVERLIALAEEKYKRIDVLVNNAGTLGPSPMPYLADYPADDFLEVLRINVVGPLLVTQKVLAQMLQQGSGSIINVTSSAGRTGYPGWGAYGVSKFGVEGLSQTWAAELAGTGVRLNWVDPGEMDTEMHALAVPECDYPLADPADCVEPFIYLASDESTGVHGQRLLAQPDAAEEAGGGT
jgi:NAD(P)-dependent dehydrogenase (short-subunit alcohol dehydrogenase family)